jgi:hypothetical protein
MHREADGPGLVGHGPGDALADPPRGVGGELIPLRVVELLDRPNESNIPLLGEIEERHSRPRVPLCDRDHQAEVRLDEPALGDSGVALYSPEEAGRLRAGLGSV